MSKAYEQIATQLLAMTDDCGQWKPCWHQRGLTTPKNAITGRRYRGFNVLSLWCSQAGNGFSLPLWATYRQWNEAGAQVSRGSKGTSVTYWSRIEKEDKTSYMVCKSFTVFNRDQVVGAPPLAEMPVNPDDRLPHVEIFVARIAEQASIKEKEGCEIPCYIPRLDKIEMPEFQAFHSSIDYYATLLHELTHWTGHKDRENRDMKGRMGTPSYAFEELVAELGACFMAADLGIEPEPRPDHAQYIAHWHALLSKDPAAFAHAASLARKAAERLTSIGTEKECEPAT